MGRVFEPRRTENGEIYLYGRESVLLKIKDYIVSQTVPENVALLGVKGVGKSSILSNAFSKKNKKAYYEEARVLVSMVSIPETTDSMKNFFSYLQNAILEAVDSLEEYDPSLYEGVMNQILEAQKKVIQRSFEIDDATVETIFNKTIDVIKNHNIKLLAVFDDFERFADSSKIKKAQYRYMRSLANTEKLSLFICTGQDLTKVSEEIKGSGFENIFRYEEIRGISEYDIEDWMSDICDELEMDFSDDLLDWVTEISGGVPAIVNTLLEISFEEMLKEKQVSLDTLYKKAYRILRPLMKDWWQFTDEVEHQILLDLANGVSKNTINRDNLIKKGYLSDSDSDEVIFTTQFFELFCLEEMINAGETEENEKNDVKEDLYQMLKEIIAEENEKYQNDIKDFVDDKLTKLLDNLLDQMPSRDEFYQNENGEFDPEKYGEAIKDYMADKLTEGDDSEILLNWHISSEMWNRFSRIRKNDCLMAYRLSSLAFSKEVPNLDYTPVTVMLGNFLEGLLNDTMLRALRKYMPDVEVKDKKGAKVRIADLHGTLTIGAFSYVFKNNHPDKSFCNFSQVKDLGLTAQKFSRFANLLSSCHTIRNKADHPGEITTFIDRNNFVKNLFLVEDCMLIFMEKFSHL